ncbi:MAG: AsmA family protein [Phycisphaeraceae bacterium]
MKKLLSIVVGLIFIVVIVGVIAFFAIDTLARRGIESGTAYATGTSASLDGADLSIRRGELKLTNLEIGNPEGFQSPHFMQLDEGDVAVTLRSLMRDEVEVPRLHLSGVDIHLERRDGRSNYDVILENLEKLQGPPEEQPDDGRKYIIREVVISDIVVHAALLPSIGEPRAITLALDDIRLTDVGSDTDQGVLLSQLSGTIMQAVMQAVIEQGAGQLPDAIAGGLKTGLSGLGELGGFGIEAVGDGVSNVLDEIAGDEGVGGAVREGLGNILGNRNNDEDDDTTEDNE